MSITVALHRLAAAVADFEHAYLLTTSSEGIVKVNATDPIVGADGVRVPLAGGMQARLNIAGNPAVTLVWPPRVRHGHTLIVDGTATTDADGILVQPATAILHRPADHADGPAWSDRESCDEDCRSV